MSLWEDYEDPADGSLGTGVILAPGTRLAGFAETAHDLLILVKVKSGETVRCFAGAGWNKSGAFSSQAGWNVYLNAWSRRLASPIKVTFSP
jgi:pectinesterase